MSLPPELEPYAQRLVRCVVDQVPLFAMAEIANPGRRQWVPAEWSDFLRSLDRCDLTVAEWARKQHLHRVDI